MHSFFEVTGLPGTRNLSAGINKCISYCFNVIFVIIASKAGSCCEFQSGEF